MITILIRKTNDSDNDININKKTNDSYNFYIHINKKIFDSHNLDINFNMRMNDSDDNEDINIKKKKIN